MQSLLFSLLAGSASFVGGNASPQFRVRQRGHGVARELAENDDFYLTYSEDGKSKALEPFILELFETPSILQDDAIPILRMAMNKFLLAEFNAIYLPQDDELESVGSEVFSYSATTKNGRRSLQEVGTVAEMQVTVTFQTEPSPSRIDLEENIRIIMSDLNYFVGNLTSFQHSDWEDVTEAYRLEMPTPAPTGPPVDGTDGIEDSGGNKGKDDADEDKNNVVGAVVPTALIAATLIALVVFLFVQRRSRTIADTPKGSDVMYAIGVENDLYSMDRSLESSRSPHGFMSAGISVDYSESVDESTPEDSVFSGIDYSASNYMSAKGTKSMLSGITNASASTIRASNMDKQERSRLKAMQNVPSHLGGSLFGFDEDAGEEDSLEDERMAPPELSQSDVSEESDTQRVAPLSPVANHRPVESDDPSPSLIGINIEQPKSSYLACYGHQQPVEPASSSHVLADLEVLASSRGPSPRNTTPISKRKTAGSGIAYNLFNCNPVMEHSNSSHHTMHFEPDGSRKLAVTPTQNKSPYSCNPSSETPQIKNAASAARKLGSVASQRSANSQRSVMSAGSDQALLDWDGAPTTVGAMSAKATRSIGGVYDSGSGGGRNRSHSVGASARQRHSRPPQPVSKSAPSSPDRSRFNPDESAYYENLSRPSTPGDNSNPLTDYDDSGYGCYPFRSNGVKAGEDPPVGGRRHVGNTDIDGTAMYQTNAMHPLDWSYKSTDMQSVGDSTMSENDEAMPRQFLFGGKKERRSRTARSPGAEPRTPGSQRSGKSATTNDTSQGSASRQLINDLVWLEKKIADVRQGSVAHPGVDTVDSLSYVSDDNEAVVSVSSRDESSEADPTVSTGRNESVMSSIVCRDCYAPPGKLHIVIHSTKDGPAVHTVKQGSSLQGHIFPGDLIISVDNVDTRTFTAEQVMKMMASKSDQERKITVLHFEEED